jgi:hypothetical protein
MAVADCWVAQADNMAAKAIEVTANLILSPSLRVIVRKTGTLGENTANGTSPGVRL